MDADPDQITNLAKAPAHAKTLAILRGELKKKLATISKP